MIETDAIASEIIGSIISMTHILMLRVVAEGVETRQQLRYLAANHCECIQGYLFSKPVPEKDALRLLKPAT